MPTNPLFTHYGTIGEQSLLDDLMVESIQVSGQDMLYLPRHLFDENRTYTEDPQSYFTEAIPIEMYIQNAESYAGDGNFLSKFGLEIRDRVMLVTAKSTFKTLIGDPYELDRPREGDLIFFPLNKKTFEVRFVDPFTMFYPLGSTYTYTMTCELYEYSNQKFTTGNDDIDDIQDMSEDLFDWAIMTEDGTALMTEDGDVLVVENYNSDEINMDDSEDIRERADEFVDFGEHNPYGDPIT